ncbi:MAG: cyclodeaminase/cyclohydrolase family protein [Candidatus Omnitrophota bacterium]
MVYKHDRICDYLDKLASKSPTPGGGSAAALIGATGIALLAKVANFTVGKEKYKSSWNEMTDILGLCKRLDAECHRLCSDDAAAYKKLSEVFKMPKGDERSARLQKALKEAMGVPMDICRKTHEAIKLCLPLAERGNANLLTDTGIASLALKCAFLSARLNVDVNLKSLKDGKLVTQMREALDSMEKDVVSSNEKVAAAVDTYLKG